MVVFSCLLSVLYMTCQPYKRTGHNDHWERTCLSGKLVHSCHMTHDLSWIGDIFTRELMHQRDQGHNPWKTYVPTRSGTYSSENICPNRDWVHIPQRPRNKYQTSTRVINIGLSTMINDVVNEEARHSMLLLNPTKPYKLKEITRKKKAIGPWPCCL